GVAGELCGERAEQVVARCGAALVEQLAEVRLQLGRGAACSVEELDLALMCESLPEGDHPAVDPADVFDGNTEHTADDVQRQWACEVADEVHPAAVDGGVDQGGRGRLDRPAVAVDRAGCEPAAEGAAHPQVALPVE